MNKETKGLSRPAEEPLEWEPPEWWDWVRGAVYVGVFWGVLQLLKLAVLAVWPKVSGFLHIWWLTLIGTTLILMIGFGLFFFKKRNQRLYGLAEIGFALAVGWASIRGVRSTSEIASWLAVLAAAYLIVRGLDNYEEGRKRELPKKF